jgi:hypothetical protein
MTIATQRHCKTVSQLHESKQTSIGPMSPRICLVVAFGETLSLSIIFLSRPTQPILYWLLRWCRSATARRFRLSSKISIFLFKSKIGARLAQLVSAWAF